MPEATTVRATVGRQVGQLADAPADTPLSRLSQVCGWNEILWETPEVTTAAMVGQLADAPADTPLSRLSHSSSSSHRGHAYAGITRLSHSFSSPTGMWLEWNPVGDAGGHDGTGRGRTTGGSVSTCASRHTAFAAVAQLQQLPQGACVRRDNAAVAQLQQPHRYVAGMESCGRRRRSRRQRWWVRQQMRQLTHRNRGCRTTPAAPQVCGWNEILWGRRRSRRYGPRSDDGGSASRCAG
jgi:hypothetical protein